MFNFPSAVKKNKTFTQNLTLDFITLKSGKYGLIKLFIIKWLQLVRKLSVRLH